MIVCPVLMDEEKNGSRTCVLSGGGDSGGGCSGDNRSSKRLKQKKVPQRGLGVAQLEKIRLEEQKKKDVVLQKQSCSNEIRPSPNNTFSSTLALQTPNFKSSNKDESPDRAPNGSFRPFFIPPPSISMSQNGVSSTNSLFRPSPSMPNIDELCSNQMTLPKSLSSGAGFDHSWPKLWNDGFNNLDMENQKLDRNGDHAYHESNNPILRFPNLMQRSMRSQHSSSKMESPSNQNYFTNKYVPLWEEEEKMIGLKRQYPFMMDTPPAPPFHEKLSSSFVDTFRTSNEASGSNGSPAIPKPRNHITRDLSSSSLQAQQNSTKTDHSNGDFLRLAPPLAASLSLDVKHKNPHDNSAHSKPDLQKASQELFEDRSRRAITSGSNILNGQPFFSFLPSPNYGSCDSEVGERVDLSLKL